MAFPLGHIRLGYYKTNGPDPRSVYVPLADYEAMVKKVRTALASSLVSGAQLRGEVSKLVGAAFDGETDEWMRDVLSQGVVLFGIPDKAESVKLKEKLPDATGVGHV